MTEAGDFWAGSAFEQMWATGAVRQPAPEADVTHHAAGVDPLIAAFWRRYGWGPFGDGLLVTQPPAQLDALYQAWRLPPSRVPILRSAWGHLWTVDGDDCYLLDPLHGEERTLGCDGVTLLDALLVVDDVLDADVLRPAYHAATAHIGRTPTIDECLGFVPALALGGILDADTAQIGELATTLDFLAQLASR